MIVFGAIWDASFATHVQMKVTADTGIVLAEKPCSATRMPAFTQYYMLGIS